MGALIATKPCLLSSHDLLPYDKDHISATLDLVGSNLRSSPQTTIASSMEPRRVAEIMLSWLGLELVSCTELQALWAGYGHICAIKARAASEAVATPWRHLGKDQNDGPGSELCLILKLISPPARTGDEGHLRKMFSYYVEQYFYDELAPRLKGVVAVAECLASTRSMREKAIADGIQHLTATIMTDLRLEFPVAGEKRSVLSPRQASAALEWLAKFHSSSWEFFPDQLDSFLLPPLEESKRRRLDPHSYGKSLWLNGGYTYLATRRKEYKDLAYDEYSEWSKAFCNQTQGSSSIAEMVADFLTPTGRPFESYIHGDVKSENLFSTDSGDRVAFFDFQYAGIGLGVCDLAKLFTCSLPLNMLTSCDEIPKELEMNEGERELLDYYRVTLLNNKPEKKSLDYEWDEFSRHWESALVDWCRFQASWGFWGNTEWLEARVRSILKDQGWNDWLRQQLKR